MKRKRIIIEVDTELDNEYLEYRIKDIIKYGFVENKTATIKVEDV